MRQNDRDRLVDEVANDLLNDGRLLTWATHPNESKVIFFIPEDCDPTMYPQSIAGMNVVLRRLPRPA
jgi:hypothetical protein